MHLERIKNMREDLDMTQKDLAKILNISQRTLSHYELGTRDIPTETLIALADFYHCSTDYLLGRTDIRSPYPYNDEEFYTLYGKVPKRAPVDWEEL